MQYALAEVRTHVDVLYNASAPSTGRRPRAGKIERHKAVVAIRNAISKKSTINALTAASVQEMVRGPQEDSAGGIPPLGWVELTIVLLETLNQACSDALTSRATSKTGRVTFRSELVFCFKEVLKLSLSNGPAGVIRPVVPAFLFFAHQWLSEPALRPLLADQVWQCVRDILQDDANRAMLTPPFIRTWVDVCVEQLTNRGPLYHSSTVVSQLAGDVLETIARNVDSYDTLTQSTKSLAPSKMLGGDFGYAIVCERCCFMLVIAETKRRASPRDARQIQAVAFRTLTATLSNQLLDAIGSNAVESIINVSLTAMIACWTDRRHHDVAVSLARVLLLIAPTHRKLVDTCRQRLIVDLRDEGSSAVLRAGQDVKDDFVDTAAACFSLRESLQFASSSESSWGLVIVWLRVCVAILSRRVLKKGTTIVLDAQDLLDQCTSAAEAITAILRGHEKIQESFYDEVIRCCTRIVNLAASIADRVAVDRKTTNSFAQEAWNDLYVALREHVRKMKYSVPRRGKYGVGGQNVQTDERLLRSLSLLRSLQLFEHWPARIDAMHMDSQSDLPYPISRLTSSKHFPSAMEIEYTRTLIARNGVPDLHGRRLRLRLALALVGLCKDFDASRTPAVKTLVDASCVVLGLARGECTISHCPAGKSCVDVEEHISKGLASDAFNAFQSYFGFCASEEKIIGEGSTLVAKVKQQELVWPFSSASVGIFSGVSEESAVTPDCDKELSSLQTRKHFSVDPAITDEIETNILLKATTFLSTTRAVSPRKMGVSYTSVSEHSSEVEEAHHLSEEHLSYSKAKLIVFLGSYLLQGISLGTISTGKRITPNENRASEELMKLLTQLTKSFSCSPYIILVSRVELSLGVIQVSCSLLKALETCLRPSSGNRMQNHSVWVQLLEALSKSTSSISAKLSTGLAEACVTQTKENIRKIHHFTNGHLSDPSSQQFLPLKRSRGPSSPSTRHRAKRKRVSRGHLDLERRNDENDRRDIISSHEDHKAFGDEGGSHFDSDSSESDGFDNFETDQNHTRAERRGNPREQIPASRLAKNASCLLRACVKELPTVEDLVLDNILEGIQHLDDLESALSPDGFERSALASTLVDHTFLDLRTSLWVVLFSLRTNRAVEAAARDLLKAGLYWRGLETTAHQYVSFYVESLQLSNNSRKHYPLPCFLEQFRISFLDHARTFLKKCQLPDDSDAVELNRPHIREPQRCPLHLVSSIVEVSEHFRTRHAFRMPRMTRVSYYRFGLAALELFCARSVDLTAVTEHEAPQSTTLQNMIQAIRAALLKFLSDSEATVRFVAALLFPRLLATFKCPVSQLETILRDSIPQSSACRESVSYYGRVIGERAGADTQNAVVTQLSLSAHEQIGCASISESFRTIGARAKAHTVFVALCELGSAREDLLPFCLLLILLRVLENGKHVSAAYQALVRLCITKGYYSPRHLYHTLARLLLSKWFKYPQALQWLYQFPASVLVDVDHHRDGVLFDWIREQQSVLLPHVLVLDTVPSLPRTTELAEAIGVDLKVLLSTNVASSSLIFPMQFAGSLHERGRALWKAIDNVLDGKSKELMFKHKTEVLRSFLLSTSCGCISRQPENRYRLDQAESLGFSRDTREVRPPLYDPLVVALAIDQLFEVDSDRLIIQRSILKGSLFSDLRDEENGACLAANFNGFLEECQKSKVFLIRMLVMISNFLMGPPIPKPAQHRRDAFFCVGMLWRTLGVNILVKSSSERVIFYKLMAKGFEHYETVHDAAWLLLEVQKEVSCLADRYPEVKVIATDLSVDPAESEHLHCMTTSGERQMFELLSAVTPVLVSIISKSTRATSDVLHNVSLVALNNLVQVCHDEGLWTSILCNGPYPKSKHFLKVRALYEASKASAECNPTEDAAGAIVAGLKRFHVVCRLRAQNESFFPTFACIQELHRLLSDSAVSELSRRMNSEAWVRSNGQHEQTAPHVRRAIACLIQFVHAIERDLRKRKPEGSFVSRTSTRLGDNERAKKMEGMAHEIADVMALLGLLQPQSEMYLRGESRHKLIPSLALNQGYEEISCGIRLSLVLLLKMVHGSSPIAAEAAISTLIQILRTEDGKRLYARDKFNLGICAPFRNAARKLAVTAGSSSPVNIIDPSTGEPVPRASFPALMDSHLWDINKDERFSLPGDESWMRRFCCVLANMCVSGALKTLSVPCYISHQFASEMLPYLLMDVVTQNRSQNHVDMGYLLCENILNDPKTPSNIVRAFVHALDVLCQVGSRVICQKGITSAIEEGKAWPICRPRYVLAVPYIDAARAALRTGCYFSAVRFSQMHVDQKVAEREFRIFSRAQNHKTDRKWSSYMTRDSSVERAEENARNDVKEILLLAMTRIQEPDGVRAFGNNADLSQAAARLAMLDEDWIRSLSALDIASRMTRGSSWSIARQPTGEIESEMLDMNRELSLFHSLLRLGTLSIATDYWNGLQCRTSKNGVQHEDAAQCYKNSPIDKLNDLRYAVAWKLGQWESPALLPSFLPSAGGIERPHGFHSTVYRVLHSFRTERFVEALKLLSSSKTRELLGLVRDSSGVSAGTVYATAARLQIFRILEEAQLQCSPPVTGAGKESQRFDSEGKTRNPTASALQANVEFRSEFDRDSDEQVLRRPGLTSKKTDGIIDRVLYGSFGGYDAGSANSAIVPFRDAFSDIVLAEELPIALVHCLRADKMTARAAATISARVLRAGGSGAWSRSASCLGTELSSQLTSASHVDRVAWKLQEARLRWLSSHDAASRKIALVAVKDIISSELGGSPENGNSNVSEDATPPQAVVWDAVADDCDKHAFLRSEACRLAAIWSLDMRTHEPMKLFETFLESGLQAVHASAEAKHLACPAHMAMATFADAQLANIDAYRKTRKYDEMVSSLRAAEEKICKLKAMKNKRQAKPKKPSGRLRRSSRSEVTSGATTDHQIGRDLQMLINNEAKKARMDRLRLENLNDLYRKWQIIACKHFASSLRDGNDQDLRAAFRFVALWLDAGQMRDRISTELAIDTDGVDIGVPVSKLLPLAPQLSSRLSPLGNIGSGAFQIALSNTVRQMAEAFPAYCLWQLVALSNSTRISANQEKYSSLYLGDKDKKEAADKILNDLTALHGDAVRDMKKVADAYILLSETSDSQKSRGYLDMSQSLLLKLGELENVPVPTVPLPLNANDYRSDLPHIVKFERRASVCAGLSKPLRIVCYGSDGKSYPQMVKGRDDLRGDAVMEQLFTILNSLLEKDADAAKRSLLVRTYRIVPLSPFSGIMQFVSNTQQFKEILTEKNKSNGPHRGGASLHERYRPNDMKHEKIFEKAFQLKSRENQTKRIQFLTKVWHVFQPVFRFFFLEQWPDPAEWFSHQLAYSRSVAVMSVVGFILGLGDRHLSNILLDIVTGEVVHIDFGIAFEQGKLLPTPERMPFRLTRDLVDGFGIAGVEGVFRRCSEVTLSVMQRNKDVLLTIVEVLLHDPMFNWALTPEEVLREQNSRDGSDQDIFESDDLSRSLDESAVAQKVNNDISGSTEAHRALNRISEKLDGLEGTERLSVEAHVARLIDEAQAFHVIAAVYPGWAPWL